MAPVCFTPSVISNKLDGIVLNKVVNAIRDELMVEGMSACCYSGTRLGQVCVLAVIVAPGWGRYVCLLL